jgi:hypothetical protein
VGGGGEFANIDVLGLVETFCDYCSLKHHVPGYDWSEVILKVSGLRFFDFIFSHDFTTPSQWALGSSLVLFRI